MLFDHLIISSPAIRFMKTIGMVFTWKIQNIVILPAITSIIIIEMGYTRITHIILRFSAMYSWKIFIMECFWIQPVMILRFGPIILWITLWIKRMQFQAQITGIMEHMGIIGVIILQDILQPWMLESFGILRTK